ncbi:uncharacterized protein B0H18DRAFT_1018159 [Fomitopsis serialis]|uniref:uncharacterized protein n=1 Tax=Fomitopsis serialis TaxID=139415 RepID=UPI00200855EF|nr:uncharacterized protein B0H18DRAFT_1018159 [Neoantrodia serialis]KAH9922385.1 hypothetical protein B0H18DRAFT_1018159 [Neoantrodia serialis]
MPHVAQQNDVDIIELDSSPDLRPQTRARRANRPAGKGKKRAQFVPTGDVIELSDSDVEAPVVHVPRRQRPSPAGAGAPVAGPSRVVQLPLFFPGSDDEASVGHASMASSSKNGDSVDIPGNMANLHIGQVAPAAALLAQPAVPDVPPQEAPAMPVDPEPNAMVVKIPVDDGPTRRDGYVAQVLEIVPDVLPEHVRTLLQLHEPAFKDRAVEQILHTLFENPNYPKAESKGKGKRKREDADDEREAKSVKVDYASTNREFYGPMYALQALERLYVDFPTVPVAHVRATFRSCSQLYAPTYIYLHEEANSPNPPYRPKSASSKRQPKGKLKPHEELEKEIAWVELKFMAEPGNAAGEAASAPAAAVVAAPAELEPEDGGIECGCCFTNYAFDKMIQELLGSHDANIVCMDQSGCKLVFPESELRRFLTPKLLSLYERVTQRKEIEAAGLVGLEECPHCDYKVVIENDQEKLFRCQNEDCMAVTCRQCKKPDHLPKSCKEMEDDKKLDARHTIEEAMTAALMRNCPRCQKVTRILQCNKMVCPNCRTLSCYVCRKVINGYDHFNNPPPYNGHKDPNKCELWDSVEKRHSEEVTAAAKRAVEEYKRAHPEVAEEDLRVDLPPAPVAGPSNVPGMPQRPMPAQRVFVENDPFGLQAYGGGLVMHHAAPPPPPMGHPDIVDIQRGHHAQVMAMRQAQAEMQRAARLLRAQERLRDVAHLEGLGYAAAPPAMPPLPPRAAAALYYAGDPPPMYDAPPAAAPPPPPVVAGRGAVRRARARR